VLSETHGGEAMKKLSIFEWHESSMTMLQLKALCLKQFLVQKSITEME
jgi:hypothetical protein